MPFDTYTELHSITWGKHIPLLLEASRNAHHKPVKFRGLAYHAALVTLRFRRSKYSSKVTPGARQVDPLSRNFPVPPELVLFFLMGSCFSYYFQPYLFARNKTKEPEVRLDGD